MSLLGDTSSSKRTHRLSRDAGSDWVRAGESSIHGRGVYARRPIPDGTRVIEYVGERITKAEARRREALRIERQRQGGDGCVYIFTLNSRYDLDGSGTNNVARLINHSCSPNCRAELIRGRIWIIARRGIPKGAELTFDYGYAFSEWPLHPCRCGAAKCVGFIVNAAQRWRVRRILSQRRAARNATDAAGVTAAGGSGRRGRRSRATTRRD